MIINQIAKKSGNSGGGETQYLHSITIEGRTFTTVNNNSGIMAEWDDGTGTYNIMGWNDGYWEVVGCGCCDYGEYHLQSLTNSDEDTFYTSGYDESQESVIAYSGGSSGSSQLTVTIDGTQYPITAGMTWGHFIAEHSDEFWTDYSGGLGWSIYLDCWDCGSYIDRYIDPVVGGYNGTVFGVDGSFAMPTLVINPYVTYYTDYSPPGNFMLNYIS